MRAPTYASRFEPIAWEVAAALFGRTASSDAELARVLREAPPPAGPPSAAHLLFALVGDLDRFVVPVAELDAAGALVPGGAEKRVLRVLDVGSGAGALGLLAFLMDRDSDRDRDRLERPGRGASGRVGGVHVQAVGRDATALDFARRIFERALATGVVDEGASWTAREGKGAPEPERDPFDVVFANGSDEPLLRALLRQAGAHGSLVVVEPRGRAATRELEAARDRILADGGARVFAPCLRQGPCPVLRDERSNCYEDRPWTPPPRLHALALGAGLARPALRFGYLVLRTDDAAQVVPPPGASAWRVVSDPLRSKGKHEAFLCGEADRFRARLLHRNRNEANRSIESARRGDVVTLAGDPPLADRDRGFLEIGPATEVAVARRG